MFLMWRIEAHFGDKAVFTNEEVAIVNQMRMFLLCAKVKTQLNYYSLQV